MSDVSVIIPTFNRARMLEECVASLLQQTRPPFEILIVDDGSTDDTAEVAQRMPALVRYLSKRNAGKPAALNFAIPHARGSWLWFFDDDDVALPRSIEARLHAAEQTPGAQIIISRFLWGTNDSAGRLEVGHALKWPAFTAADFYPKFLRSCFAHMNGAMMRRERVLEVGEFRADLLTSEDYDFTLRVARGALVAICDEPTFIFRQHAGARGPAAQRFLATDRLRKFAAGDAEIGRSIRATHRLPEYLGQPADSELDPALRCDALLARLEVMAGKGLLPELAADALLFCRAIDELNRGIDARTATTLKSAMQQRYLAFALAKSPLAALRQLGPLRSSPAGRAAMRVMARAVAGDAWWQKIRLIERCGLTALALALAILARRA